MSESHPTSYYFSIKAQSPLVVGWVRELMTAYGPHLFPEDLTQRTAPAPDDTGITLELGVLGQDDRPLARIALGQEDLSFPLRGGKLLEKVQRFLQDRSLCGKIWIGPFHLAVPDGVLSHRDTGETIRLTDKERDLLLALHDAPLRTLDRKALLESVWGYVEGVETHTLETHIYRLRQKIEADPAKPQILLTDGQGYRLAQES